MNCYNIVLGYINAIENNEPIFIEDVKKHVATFYEKRDLTKVFNNVKAILNRLKREGKIKQADKGIYYKPTFTIWGRETVPPIHKIRDYKYIIEKDGTIKGYITGAKLFNLLGLTTQIPRMTEIATNECPNNNKYVIDKYDVIIRKPKMKVTNDNYKYLQFIDVLENNDNVNIEIENEQKVLYHYMKEHDLSFEKTLKYARETNNKKILTRLWTLAR